MSGPMLSAAELPPVAAALLDRLRRHGPRVHCLMNTVVQKLVADGLSALGAVPSMTSSPDEVEAFVTKADALSINLGTLDAQRRRAIRLAADAAALHGRPWVLDPAHCDYSPPRAVFADRLLECRPDVLRANPTEHQLLTVPREVIAVKTGKADRITHGSGVFSVENGHALMAKVTGTGCLSGAVIAAFLAVADEPFAATAAAMLVMGVAAEIAGGQARGPGTFEPALLDALHDITANDILKHAKVRDE